MATKTETQCSEQIARALELVSKKHQDYGSSSWRVLRSSSITDQIYIKAKRLRSIQDLGKQLVDDSLESEFIGILNYSIMGLIQLDEKSKELPLELTQEQVVDLYNSEISKITELRSCKNTDYGEAWREMRISSMADFILAKLLRIKQIENNKGATLVSEGITAGYQDIVNYALFCLIRISEGENPMW